jgi:hypothetical protein
MMGAFALETTLGPPTAFSALPDDGEELYATRKTAETATNVCLIIVPLLSTIKKLDLSILKCTTNQYTDTTRF